jgi:3-methyladenine DNA glycosylase/8-oxoguanine DNA glycosylase
VHDALAGLAKRDPVLGEVIHKAGVLPRIAQCQVARGAVHEPNRAFRALARAIVFQQLNGAAAATIFGRVATLVGAESDPTRLSPEAVLSADPGLMRACGLSQRKLEYLNGLAEAFTEKPGIGGLGDAFLERRGLRDDELRNALISLRGVGPWTVDMFCVFYLNRADVLPVGDFGVRKGMMRVYGLSAMPSPEEMEKISESWRPTRTLASFYMWHAADEAEAEVRLERATARGKKSKKEVVTG